MTLEQKFESELKVLVTSKQTVFNYSHYASYRQTGEPIGVLIGMSFCLGADKLPIAFKLDLDFYKPTKWNNTYIDGEDAEEPQVINDNPELINSDAMNQVNILIQQLVKTEEISNLYKKTFSLSPEAICVPKNIYIGIGQKASEDLRDNFFEK